MSSGTLHKVHPFHPGATTHLSRTSRPRVRSCDPALHDIHTQTISGSAGSCQLSRPQSSHSTPLPTAHAHSLKLRPYPLTETLLLEAPRPLHSNGRPATRPLTLVARSQSSSTNPILDQSTAKAEIRRIIETLGPQASGRLDGNAAGAPAGSFGLYADDPTRKRLGQAVSALVQENPTERPGEQSLVLGQGAWEVFHAPHLSSMAGLLATRFDPIRYELRGRHITSHVRYSSPLAGAGWLSASGEFRAAPGGGAVEVLFDKFWWDLGEAALQADPDVQQGPWLQRIINALGRAAFFPQFSVFPVLYVDTDFAVFQFTPLKSNIAVRRT